MPGIPRELTFSQMREHNLPYWTIMQNKNTILSKCPNISDVDVQIEKLNEILNILATTMSHVDVKFSAYTNDEIHEGNPKAKKGMYHTIELNKSLNVTPSQISGVSETNVSTLLEIEKKKHEFELEKLKFLKDVELEAMRKEIATLREDFMKQDDDDDDDEDGIHGIEKIWEESKPYIPYILASMGMMPKPKAMAEDVNKIIVEGDEVSEKESPAIDNEQLKKISIACRRLLKIDYHAGDNLLKLAEFAELNPDGYFGVIPMMEMQIEMYKKK